MTLRCRAAIWCACATLTALPGPIGDGIAFYLKGEYAASIKSYRAALDTKIGADEKACCWYMIGQASLMSGSVAGAREAFTTVVTDYAKTEWSAHARVGLGDVFYREKNYTEAVRSYIAANTGQYAQQFGSAICYRLAKAYRALNDFAKAQHYEQLLRTGFPGSLETGQVPKGSSAVSGATAYYIQVATLSTSTRAKYLVAELGHKNIPARAESYMPGTPNSYRVIVGPYTTKSSADTMLAKVHRDGYPGAMLKKVGE